MKKHLSFVAAVTLLASCGSDSSKSQFSTTASSVTPTSVDAARPWLSTKALVIVDGKLSLFEADGGKMTAKKYKHKIAEHSAIASKNGVRVAYKDEDAIKLAEYTEADGMEERSKMDSLDHFRFVASNAVFGHSGENARLYTLDQEMKPLSTYTQINAGDYPTRELYTFVVGHQGEAYFLGGISTGDDAEVQATYVLSSAGQMKKASTLDDEMRYATASLPYGNLTILAGGYDSEGNAVKRISAFDPTTGDFTEMGSLGKARGDASMVKVTDKITVADKVDADGNPVLDADGNQVQTTTQTEEFVVVGGCPKDPRKEDNKLDDCYKSMEIVTLTSVDGGRPTVSHRTSGTETKVARAGSQAVAYAAGADSYSVLVVGGFGEAASQRDSSEKLSQAAVEKEKKDD